MITGDLKPLEEIVQTIAEFRKVLVVGCGGCVSVCLTGGDRQARNLARELAHTRHYEQDPPSFQSETIQRQCEPDWLTSYFEIPEGVDAILSLACGAGVQTMAQIFEPLPVIPALNTTFLGALTERGQWAEMCRGCGDCVLAYTGGVCPVARCAKSLFNGPCGGSQGGWCEINTWTPCAWALIYARLTKLGKVHFMMDVKLQKDWRPAGHAGPRMLNTSGVSSED